MASDTPTLTLGLALGTYHSFNLF